MKRGQSPFVGFLAGVVFGVMLTGYLFLTGMLDITASGYSTSAMLVQALPRALRDLMPWLLVWLFVTPALQRIPFARPWLALFVSAGFAVVFVPVLIGPSDPTPLQLGAVFLFSLVIGLPIVRANDVWMSATFFVGLHFVTVTLMGMPFGRLGEGVFAARLHGDALVTGGLLGPVFGFIGMLGQLSIASSVLQNQRVLFARASVGRRTLPRRSALRHLAFGLAVSTVGATLFFVLTIATGHSIISRFDPSIAAITSSLTTALPAAIASVIWPCLIAAMVFVVFGRGWPAALVATSIMVLIDYQAPVGNAFTAASDGAMTLAITLAFARTRRLWMPIGLTFGWLLCEGPIFGFPTNGFPVRHPWFQQEVLRYSSMSGGVIGPAASVFAIGAKCFVVIVVAWVMQPHIRRRL